MVWGRWCRTTSWIPFGFMDGLTSFFASPFRRCGIFENDPNNNQASMVVMYLVTNLVWCGCRALGSLLTLCCGNDTTGWKRSTFLFVISVGLQLGFQYGLAPWFVDQGRDGKLTTIHTGWYEEFFKSWFGHDANDRVGSTTTNIFILLATLVVLWKFKAWSANCVSHVLITAVTSLFPTYLMQPGYYPFGLSPWFINWIATTIIRERWYKGCDGDPTMIDTDQQEELFISCVGRVANYRVGATTTLFFVLAALAAALWNPSANRKAWPAKYILYLSTIAATIFIGNKPIFTPIYWWMAIVGGVFFIVFLQLIVLDVAHSWNDWWLDKANRAETEESGSGEKWVKAYLASCAVLLVGAFGALVFMTIKFTGLCPTNKMVIVMTLISCIALMVIPFLVEEASLLNSATISAWAAFLCYRAISQNPDPVCNPLLVENIGPFRSAVEIVLVTLLCLAWMGWSSYTTANNGSNNVAAPTNDEVDYGKRRLVRGVAVSAYDMDDTDQTQYGATDSQEHAIAADETTVANDVWQMNIALASASCWSTLILTEQVGMWGIIGSQWLVLVLYLWTTLIAPRVFPNRDFSQF